MAGRTAHDSQTVGTAAPGDARRHLLVSSRGTRLDSLAPSNNLAKKPQKPGYGAYTRDEIQEVLETAFIGFSACKRESGSSQAVVHTGNWGCGAYGGNPVLMALLQLTAARLAGIDRLVNNTVSPRFSEAYLQAVELSDEVLQGEVVDTAEFIERVHSMEFEWGESDGN